ncbi:NAD(P)/FAD-dependent oxidoreductase [Pedobacter sp. MW01-1-1]|uniref:NAD(P)/FAD-dependent oxidoreductase n=1 Tax=Pedobacter sp. MW01-1-1 TaxID=3383027 RepID=UPI003FF0C770
MKIRSNEPYWLVKNGLINSYPSLQKDIETDVLIVGAGITGALMAHACVKKGFKTVLIDKREVVNGSSSATTSMLQYEIDVPLCQLIELIGEEGAVAAYKACRDAIYKLEDIVQAIKSTAGFERKESLYFAADEKDIELLKQEFESRKYYGFNVKWLSSKVIWAAYKLKAAGGILSEDGASVDAFKLAHDLLAYNVKKGLKVYDKTMLNATRAEKEGVLAEVESGAKIYAKKVIYCTGYETQELLPEKIVNLKSTFAMVSEQNDLLEQNLKNTLFWNTASPYLYLRTTEDNRLLVGGADEDFKDPVKRDLLLDKKTTKLIGQIGDIMPELTYLQDFSWCGTFGETKDGLPYIGAHPKFLNSYFVLGFGGNGITFSVLGMEIITGLMTGNPDLLAYFFRFNR